MATGKSWMDANTLTAEQKRNAATIVAVGRQLGASERDITIALMTAAQESEFRNIGYGDDAGPDSRGLFQQREGWGTLAQRMDPIQATIMFFTGGHDGQRGLFDFKNREELSLTRAAQAVQVSAHPEAYAKHQQLAEALLGPAPAARAASEPTGTITLNPTVDRTPGAQATQAPAGQSPVTPAPASPVGRTTDPVGRTTSAVDRVTDPTATLGDPAAMATENAPPAPMPAPRSLTLAQFRQMFPDAATTAMFSDPTGGAQRRNDAITIAMSYIGTPYAWGGDDRSGLDCSGLVQQVYKGFGVDLPRLSADQLRSGARTAYADLKPGDLIGWQHGDRNGSGVEHIAIYAGNGQIIEAPRPGIAVRRRKLSDAEIASAEGAHFAQLD